MGGSNATKTKTRTNATPDMFWNGHRPQANETVEPSESGESGESGFESLERVLALIKC